jgi:hypothetical protein
MGTLREDLCTYVKISQWIILNMRNVADKHCTENQNTYYVQYIFSKNHATCEVI